MFSKYIMSVSLLQVPEMAVANGAGGGSGPTPPSSAGIFEWQGGTTSTVAYAVGDAVYAGLLGYVCVAAQPIGSPPPAYSEDRSSGWTPFGSDLLQNIAGNVGVTCGGANSSTGENIPALGLFTPNTGLNMEFINGSGEAGQINITAAGIAPTPVAPGRITIGGTVNSTGLYVGNTQILFNGVALEQSTGTYLVYLGAWAAPTVYAVNDVVIYESVAWVSLVSGNSGNTPAFPSTTFWQPLAPAAGGGNLPSGAVSMIGMNAAAGYFWQGDGNTPQLSTIEYPVGAVVYYDVNSVFYMANTLRPVGSPTPDLDTKWQSFSSSATPPPAGDAAAVATNTAGANAWAGNGATPELSTRAYNPGDIATYTLSGFQGWYICNNAVDIGSADPDTDDGANWTRMTASGIAAEGLGQHYVACSDTGIILSSDDTFTQGQLAVGGPYTTTGLYVSNTEILYNGNPLATSNPVTVPNSGGGNNNQWVSGSAYSVGSVVYSPTEPYNWFLCYVVVPSGTATDPQADVNAGAFGQGTYWQLLAVSSFTTTTGTTPGTFYGALTLSGTAITSTNLATGEVVIDGGSGPSGPAMLYQGAWVGTTSYNLNDVVISASVAWVSVAASNLNNTPTYANTTFWQPLVPEASVPSGNTITGGESGNVGTVSCNSVNGNITTVTSGTAGINFRVNLDSHLNIAPSTGDIELGATDPAGTQNLVTVKTVLPSGSTSSTDAFLKLDSGGQIDIRSEKDLVVYSTTGGVDVESFDELYLNSKTAGISIQLFSGEAGYVDITPGQGDSNAMGGAVLYDCGDFNPAKNYGIGAVVVYLGETWVSTKYNIGSTTPPVAGPEWFKLSGSSGTGVTGLTTPVGSGLSLSAATGAVVLDTTIGAGPGVNVVRGTTGTDLTISNAGIIELTTANGCGITQINEAGIVALSANLLAGTGVSLAPSGSNTDITINLTYPKMLTGTWQVTTRDSISTNSFIIQYGQATPPSDTAAVTYDNVTNVGRFTVVTPGLYQITLSTAFNAQDLVLPTQHTLDCLINVFTNGGVQNSVACQTLCMAEPPLDNIYALTTTTVKLLAGEYWTTQTFLRTGGNLFPGGFYYVEPPANDVSNGTSCTWVLLSAD